MQCHSKHERGSEGQQERRRTPLLLSGFRWGSFSHFFLLIGFNSFVKRFQKMIGRTHTHPKFINSEEYFQERGEDALLT